MNKEESSYGDGESDNSSHNIPTNTPENNATVEDSVEVQAALDASPDSEMISEVRKVYQCFEPNCEFWSIRGKRFHEHMIDIHSYNVRPYHCSVCNYHTRWKFDVNKHCRNQLGKGDLKHTGAHMITTTDIEQKMFKKYDHLRADKVIFCTKIPMLISIPEAVIPSINTSKPKPIQPKPVLPESPLCHPVLQPPPVVKLESPAIEDVLVEQQKNSKIESQIPILIFTPTIISSNLLDYIPPKATKLRQKRAEILNRKQKADESKKKSLVMDSTLPYLVPVKRTVNSKLSSIKSSERTGNSKLSSVKLSDFQKYPKIESNEPISIQNPISSPQVKVCIADDQIDQTEFVEPNVSRSKTAEKTYRASPKMRNIIRNIPGNQETSGMSGTDSRLVVTGGALTADCGKDTDIDITKPRNTSTLWKCKTCLFSHSSSDVVSSHIHEVHTQISSLPAIDSGDLEKETLTEFDCVKFPALLSNSSYTDQVSEFMYNGNLEDSNMQCVHCDYMSNDLNKIEKHYHLAHSKISAPCDICLGDMKKHRKICHRDVILPKFSYETSSSESPLSSGQSTPPSLMDTECTTQVCLPYPPQVAVSFTGIADEFAVGMPAIKNEPVSYSRSQSPMSGTMTDYDLTQSWLIPWHHLMFHDYVRKIEDETYDRSFGIFENIFSNQRLEIGECVTKTSKSFEERNCTDTNCESEIETVPAKSSCTPKFSEVSSYLGTQSSAESFGESNCESMDFNIDTETENVTLVTSYASSISEISPSFRKEGDAVERDHTTEVTESLNGSNYENIEFNNGPEIKNVPALLPCTPNVLKDSSCFGIQGEAVGDHTAKMDESFQKSNCEIMESNEQHIEKISAVSFSTSDIPQNSSCLNTRCQTTSQRAEYFKESNNENMQVHDDPEIKNCQTISSYASDIPNNFSHIGTQAQAVVGDQIAETGLLFEESNGDENMQSNEQEITNFSTTSSYTSDCSENSSCSDTTISTIGDDEEVSGNNLLDSVHDKQFDEYYESDNTNGDSKTSLFDEEKQEPNLGNIFENKLEDTLNLVSNSDNGDHKIETENEEKIATQYVEVSLSPASSIILTEPSSPNCSKFDEYKNSTDEMNSLAYSIDVESNCNQQEQVDTVPLTSTTDEKMDTEPIKSEEKMNTESIKSEEKMDTESIKSEEKMDTEPIKSEEDSLNDPEEQEITDFIETCWALKDKEFILPEMTHYRDLIPRTSQPKVVKPERLRCNQCHFHTENIDVLSEHLSHHQPQDYCLKPSEARCEIPMCTFVCENGVSMKEHTSWHFSDHVRDGVQGYFYYGGPIEIFYTKNGKKHTVYKQREEDYSSD